MAVKPRNVWALNCELGEGPVWVERDAALWFVDIKTQKIHRYDPAGGGGRSWDAPEQIGFILPAASGGFVAGLQSGLYRFDEAACTFEALVEVEPDQPTNRINDGVVDGSGRLWFGTMDNGERAPTGSFYRFEGGEVVSTGLAGISITNGPALSPDGRILYYVDTLKGTIEACDVARDGTLGPSRPFVHISSEEGYPDGPTLDAEGCVWISLYAGWEARRYSPVGELLQTVRFPVANITKIAFGGPELRTVYATTARQKMSAHEIAAQPEIGDLFEFPVDIPGIPCPMVAA
jgi:sugar lactone lactonase YvrE